MSPEEEEMLFKIFDDNFIFASNLYKYQKSENDLFSPLGLHMLLTLVFQDPNYHHLKRLIDGLDINSPYDANLYVKNYEKFLKMFKALNNETLSFSNKALLRESYQTEVNFSDLLSKFNYEVESFDFTKPEATSETINSWIENQTKVRIRNLISTNLNVDTRLSLLQTMNFNGKWNQPFTLEDNPMPFHLNEHESIPTQMMKTTGEFYYKYGEYDKLKVVELPFETDDVSLIVVLPDKGCDLKDNISRGWFLQTITDDMNKEVVDVMLPKLQIENFANCLNELDLEENIGKNGHFFGIFDNDEFLKFDRVDRSDFADFTEQGLTMATGLGLAAVSNVDEEETATDGLKVLSMNIKTTISNRFGKTLVTCKIQNNDKSPKEATFTVILPETAFITEFIMEMDGKSHKSEIKEKGAAKTIYEGAVAVGKSAGMVEADTRDSSKFEISVNLEPHSLAVFLLTYEEMLQRVHDQYEVVLNINPKQIVDNLNVEVYINESRPLKFVKTPPLRSGKEFNKRIEKYLNPSADIKMISSNSAVVKYSPNAKTQKKICHYLGNPVTEGFSGQFVVQYDVEREPLNGEILLQDGYFVHFFAPNDLDPLPKHVVFVLDTSGSMSGRKIEQLKDAMMSILGELRKDDLISIIEFSFSVTVWNISSEQPTPLNFHENADFKNPFGTISECRVPNPTFINDETREKAKRVVKRMQADGGTFIIGGLEVALYVTKLGEKQVVNKESRYQPVIIFLTDGEPNIGISSPPEITQIVTQLNMKHNKVPIFSLSFGEHADKAFLRQLSLKNYGFSRHIYEASDASLQLQSFYKQISSPLLTDIHFKYDSDVRDVTRSHFPMYFSGSELVVSGRCRETCPSIIINGCGPKGLVTLNSNSDRPVSSLERLWAYLTVKQLLEERNFEENAQELTKRAIDLALKYSFVTEVTSLVVVKPDKEPEIAEELLDGTFDSLNRCDLRNRGIAMCQSAMYAPSLRSISRPMSSVCSADPNVVQVNAMVFRSMLSKRKYAKWAPGQEDSNLDESVPEPVSLKLKKMEFIADRPFLIMLMLKKGHKKTILFLGYVNKPSSN